MKYAIMRMHCLPEDEGRDFLIKICTTREEAEDWIAAQEGKYFRPSDYKIFEEPKE